MKKFTNITNTSVGKEPKETSVDKKEVKLNEERDIKRMVIRKLMDDFLSVGIYGNINPVINGSLKVEGKDILVEAILSSLEELEEDKTVSLLESVKSYSGDWESIDKAIDSIREARTTAKQIESNQDRLIEILKRDEPEVWAQKLADKMKNGKKAYWMANTAQSLKSKGKWTNSLLDKISDIFMFASQRCGYNPTFNK